MSDLESVAKRRPTTSGWLPLVAFASVSALIIVFLLRDASAFVNSAQDELIGHVGASGGFTVAASGTHLTLRRTRPALLTVLLAGAAIGIAAELAQGLVPDRGIELSDIATGFGGVLIAGVGIEVVLRTFTHMATLRIHTAVAAAASVVLAILLVFDLAPQTLAEARPDGTSCPLTTLSDAQRIEIGPDPSFEDACLRTDAGGLGLFGPGGTNRLNDESVLVSSGLTQLASDILNERRLVITIGFTTADFGEDVRRAGVMISLRSDQAGELLQVRTRDASTQVMAPNLVQPYRSLSYTELLEANTEHQLQVELTGTELLVRLDDELVASNRVDPAWLDLFDEANDTDDLTLYIGNSPNRSSPFRGVIEWVEIGT